MRRRLYFPFIALLLLLLSGCGNESGAETRILVSIRESAGFTVENNGQYIQPGETVEFLLNTNEGSFLAETDYDGVYHTALAGKQTRLTLENVQYPTHVTVRLADFHTPTAYDPNGGTGGAATNTDDPNGGAGGANTNTDDPNGGTGGADTITDHPNGGTGGANTITDHPNGGTGGANTITDHPNGGTGGAATNTDHPNGGIGGANTITYDPNGGTGEVTTIAYDTTTHRRPNTSIGTDIFSRDGYTLVGWNTRADGMGDRVGLGSRVSMPAKGLNLYAQWAKWSDEGDFDWAYNENGITVTGYHGNDAIVTVPALLDDMEVTLVAAGAFRSCAMTEVILPETLTAVEDGAFQNCALEAFTLFDNIESIGDGAFTGCLQLRTLHINAIERPSGAYSRRESCYADKADLLILAQGEKKIVFYGGCSTWYNLDSSMLSPLLKQGYYVVNLGLNGTVNSSVQMQILGNFLEAGDVLFHTPELSSPRQMLIDLTMDEDDAKLWCGLEYNYDLFALVDLRTVPGALDSFCSYLSKKVNGTSYTAVFRTNGSIFWDEYGCIPFYRAQEETGATLPDRVYLDPSAIDGGGMARLKAFYDQYQSRGVRVYLSYACVNMDAVPKEQRDNVELIDNLFREAIEEMDGPVLISNLEDFLYHRSDFYDTNYHLLSEPARYNTAVWLRDLQAQMERDGLWREL